MDLAKNDTIPWKSKTDLNFFKSKTLNNTVIMGSKTLLSLPNAMPLKNRTNIVITLTPNYTPHKLRRRFDLNAVRTGQAYKDGFI